MRRNVAGLVIVFVGAAILQVAASDTYLRYVKPGMRMALLVSGLILIVLAVSDVFADNNKQPAGQGQGHDHGDGHSHHGMPRVAWLLLLPVFALLVVDPPALGADAAQRQSPVAARPAQPGVQLPGGDPTVPVALPVRDYAVWAVWQSASLQNRAFRLTGFVTPGKDGAWYVTRIGLSCCVADGTAFMVEVRGQAAPPKNQWVEVTGQWAQPTKHPDGDIAALSGIAIRPVTAPANPYE